MSEKQIDDLIRVLELVANTGKVLSIGRSDAQFLLDLVHKYRDKQHYVQEALNDEGGNTV